MQLNTLAPAAGSKKPARRLGRGIGSTFGKTCAKGHKGQKARSGGYHKTGFEGGQNPIQRRLPKFGFTSRKSAVTAELRTHELNKVEGEVVDLAALKTAGLITKNIKFVKIILSEKPQRAFAVKALRVSKGAREAIEAAGGKVTEA